MIENQGKISSFRLRPPGHWENGKIRDPESRSDIFQIGVWGKEAALNINDNTRSA